jgi:uncharacterized protein
MRPSTPRLACSDEHPNAIDTPLGSPRTRVYRRNPCGVAYHCVHMAWRSTARRPATWTSEPEGPWMETVFADVGIAIGLLFAANVALSIFGHLIHAAPNGAIRNFLPRSSSETAVYLLMAVTASICEEIIYRGYLQTQFIFWTRSSVAGVLLQSIAFGVSHAYQGWRMTASISVFGCLFGFVALWRRSLRPGMMAHFLQDAAGGLLLARQV